jgi:hypothetical protein
MPKNKVNDPITDQEIAFARLVLAGTMTDRQAAEAVGLNPDSAAYTKSKPHVRAFMLEHRAAVQQELVQQDANEQHRRNLDRERVLDRLWEIANLSPETTRGSITGQVKAISMIVAMENFIPNRRAGDRPAIDRPAISSEKNSPPAPPAKVHTAAWLARHQRSTHGTMNDPQPSPAQQEPSSTAPGSAAEVPQNPASSHATIASLSSPSQAPLRVPDVPLFGSVPDLKVGSYTKINPFVHPR